MASHSAYWTMQEAEGGGDASQTQTIDRVPEKRKGRSPSLTPLDSTPAKRSFSAPLHGRRIVHLRYLAVGLSACQNPGCGKPLALIDCVEEKSYDLGSVLVIPCQQCGMENFIDTDSPVTAQHPGPRASTSNTKAALGKCAFQTHKIYS